MHHQFTKLKIIREIKSLSTELHVLSVRQWIKRSALNAWRGSLRHVSWQDMYFTLTAPAGDSALAGDSVSRETLQQTIYPPIQDGELWKLG